LPHFGFFYRVWGTHRGLQDEEKEEEEGGAGDEE
jgi:hypothetical protein